jgi:hypothetical protein
VAEEVEIIAESKLLAAGLQGHRHDRKAARRRERTSKPELSSNPKPSTLPGSGITEVEVTVMLPVPPLAWIEKPFSSLASNKLKARPEVPTPTAENSSIAIRNVSA